MKLQWQIAAPVLSLAMISGTAVAVWLTHEHNENQRRLAQARAFRVLAEKGDAAAQASLAFMYSHGQGVQRDFEEAARWYRKSADQGNARGETGLGYLYFTGEGVQLDFTQAANWYRKAADQGYATAERDLGDLYYYGYGVAEDYAEAGHWYRLAAAQGNAAAQYGLGCLYYYGYGVAQDRAEANRWFHKAADQGDQRAQRFLGIRGRGLNKLGKVSLLPVILISAYLLVTWMTRTSIDRDRRALAAGIAGLTLSTFRLLGAYTGILAGPFFADLLFGSAYQFSSGFFFVMLLSTLWRRAAKSMLVLAGALLTTFVMLCLGLYLMANARHTAPGAGFAVPRFYSLAGFPLGMFVAAITLLWMPDKPDSGHDSHNGGSIESETFEEDGLIS